mmetsp:Transcript_23983/g.71942  ORF Transcript_23983/g.71942 Transcript_23983/m.71942 type:complete len:221 (-) Transcript_23983:1041-1703(-)
MGSSSAGSSSMGSSSAGSASGSAAGASSSTSMASPVSSPTRSSMRSCTAARASAMARSTGLWTSGAGAGAGARARVEARDAWAFLRRLGGGTAILPSLPVRMHSGQYQSPSGTLSRPMQKVWQDDWQRPWRPSHSTRAPASSSLPQTAHGYTRWSRNRKTRPSTCATWPRHTWPMSPFVKPVTRAACTEDSNSRSRAPVAGSISTTALLPPPRSQATSTV